MCFETLLAIGDILIAVQAVITVVIIVVVVLYLYMEHNRGVVVPICEMDIEAVMEQNGINTYYDLEDESECIRVHTDNIEIFVDGIWISLHYIDCYSKIKRCTSIIANHESHVIIDKPTIRLLDTFAKVYNSDFEFD